MKIGTIGTGSIVETFLDAVQQIENVECTAVFSRRIETGETLADKYDIKQVYTDFNLLLSDENVNFIYIASPNSLHYDYALKALQNGKNVICEKPFTSTVEETKTLINLARDKKLLLFEAITTLHLPNYNKIKEKLNSLGELKLVQCNYSQYSSRYDKFLAGEVTNIFNPAFSGGSLADINIYNLHFVTRLFGKAKEVKYIANIAENGIDTSGIALLKYDNFICECTGAKDSEGPNFAIIQGTKGYIKLNGAVNRCPSLEIVIDDKIETYNEQSFSNRMVYELIDFENIYNNNDLEESYKLLDHSLKVMETAVLARKDAGIVFAADNK
ncbi:oxidoreductase [Clostridium pasteurianum DSM 525 = ATCC 6013]|uniref:Oxidoreductase n=1 Tax=Clostridium pasteurianum DSM 525 = ATCC 6013 TaxID=1262449 RepID=A0A0H3IZQ3_CLOPA|nr:Gfo/Idh/MocA family oxidoreductase [Clostridium pasteurianum]AJA46519.1 oxidoreductase [Clostridium pasteurianum DSM 525 = ATCC 6013]AJA50507.1 oxidoreductase [Clostridium pasteurianum DSM 525 = ATCC 6013]AOZ73944.1 oxidoreductase [Clostridium pasteurianum DSM 525 = ATCC 6013]AOZ77741.1 oxidoreductase [Clostridium pasteurianum]ELP61092.1 oxidoreductase [Clostridium pasteurianum DSM 525 = ATCC 6013]